MHEKMFAVIGHPIKHSLSPLMHNAVFKSLGLSYEYNAFDVREEELEEKINELKEEGFTGVNVTIPHKVNVIKYLDSLTEDAEAVGAVNTIRFNKKLVGYNTDGLGCVRAFQEASVELRGKKVLVLGAGGASRAICFQLVKQGAELCITDILVEKAVALINDIEEKTGASVGTASLEEEVVKERVKEMDVLLNASPVGMLPNVDERPINTSILRKEMVVMDIVYNPVETRLLKEAKKKGCKTINGVGMFVHQGAEALKIWLDIKPPIDVMKKTVIEALKK